MLLRICVVGLLLTSLISAQSISGDLDADSLSDSFEQQLLDRFKPRFFVSEDDCGGLPAEFAAGEAEPRIVAENGAIYGQAFPVDSPKGAFIELHYFHLWKKDCGRLGHALDVEHVSVLLENFGPTPKAVDWRALYWYAAAHEDTVCDVSHGAHATALRAQDRGARIWISRAKHASYLDHKRCKFGCGGDKCDRTQELSTGNVVNVGQKGKPLNGAIWTASSLWPFGDKLDADFDESVVQQLAAASPKKVVAVNEGLPPVRATILAGEETLGGVGTGQRHTGNALKTGRDATANAIGRAFRATGRFFSREAAPDTTASAGQASAGAENP